MFSGPLIIVPEPNPGALVVDYFNESHQGYDWEMHVRNNSGQPRSWNAVLMNRPYEQIDLSVGQYQYRLIDNGDLTYTHIFAGIGRFEPWEGIIINAPPVEPRPNASVVPLIHSF